MDNELEEFFSRDIPAVVKDPEKFRMKLGIGAEAFKYLKNVENIGSVLTTLAGGTAAAGAVFGAWFMSLGALGTLGLTVGLVSTPTGWVAAAGTGGAGAFLFIRKLFRDVRKGAVTEVPNFINSPLDILATSIAEIISLVLLKVAKADDNFCEIERLRIKAYFVSEWGLDDAFVDGLLEYDQSRADLLDFGALKQNLADIGKSGDIKVNVLADEIVRITEDVINSDGHIHPGEKFELDNLKTALGVHEKISSNRYFPALFYKQQKCFVATAVFEDEENSAVQSLRNYRDTVLSDSIPGKALIAIYWLVGPILGLIVEAIPISRNILRPPLNRLALSSEKALKRRMQDH